MKRFQSAFAQIKQAMDETEKNLDQYANMHHAKRQIKAQKKQKRRPFFRNIGL